MLREDLKKELDMLNDDQLAKVANFIADLELQSKKTSSSVPLWQRVAHAERVREFREWVLQLPKGNPSLPDEAFNRDSIYEE